MMDPSSYHSSTSNDDSLMSLDDTSSVSINDDGFLSNFESEYDSGLDTSYCDSSLGASYSDFSCASASTASSYSIAKEDLRDDDSHEGYKDTKMPAVPKKDIEEDDDMPLDYNINHNDESLFDSLRSLNDGINSLTTGLSPPSLPRPALAAAAASPPPEEETPSAPSTPPAANHENNRRSSFGSRVGSMVESLLSKPISSIGTIGTITNFDIKDAFPPLPLTDRFLSRQVTPTQAAKVKEGPRHPPPIPEFKPFKEGYGHIPSRTISEDTDDVMDIDIEPGATPPPPQKDTSMLPAEEKEALKLPPPPPPPPAPTQITPTGTSRRKKRSSSSHRKASAGGANNKQRVSSQSSSSSQKKRRKRANQKKRQRRTEPEVKNFVAISSKDVLMGRGGRSNHHEGNEAYRKRILKLQKTYKTLSRDEKTQMSKDVVQWIYNRGGQFLQRDDTNKKLAAGAEDGDPNKGEDGSRWYVVTTETARQKVSQALREDHTLQGRMLKKSRTTNYKQGQNKNKKKNPSRPAISSSASV